METCGLVECAKKVKLLPDASLTDVANCRFDIIVLPGGLCGTKEFIKSKALGEILKKQECEKRHIGAICAAPTALNAHGIAKGKKLTSYPIFAEELKGGGYEYLEEDVVKDCRLITSRGPGTAIAFSLTIIDELMGEAKVSEVAKAMLVKYERY